MTRLPMMFPVDPEAAAAWLHGDSGTDADLLDALVPQSPVVYLARMHGPQDWWPMYQLLARWQPKILIFRTRQPGLLRLLLRCGGQVAHQEPEGACRCVADGHATTTFLRRLGWLAQRRRTWEDPRAAVAALTVG